MTSTELNRAVACATGETVHEIRHRGFSPLSEDEPSTNEDELLSCFLDWDDVDEHRNVAFIDQKGRSLVAV